MPICPDRPRTVFMLGTSTPTLCVVIACFEFEAVIKGVKVKFKGKTPPNDLKSVIQLKSGIQKVGIPVGSTV